MSDDTTAIVKYHRKNNRLIKTITSKHYNCAIDLDNGVVYRHGTDSEFCPFGAELINLQCDSGNAIITLVQYNLLLKLLPKTVSHVVFDIASLRRNPDILTIMQYTRNNVILPHAIISSQQSDTSLLQSLCAVCCTITVNYMDYATCTQTCNTLLQTGHRQINIRMILSNNISDDYFRLFDNIRDGKLKISTIVFTSHHNKPIPDDTIHTLIARAPADIVFEPCVRFNRAYRTLITPCDASLSSYYITANGIGYPCICANDNTPFKGINIFQCTDFLNNVWYNEETVRFRNTVIFNNHICPLRKDANEIL
jgi:hypothetical protein